MVQYNNATNKLTLTSSIIPQLCGEVKVEINVDNYNSSYRYFFELKCPKNKKYLSQQLAFNSNVGSVVLPEVAFQFVGDIFIQLIIRNADGKLVAKSFISETPIFSVKESINATEKISDELYLDYIANVINSVNQLVEIKNDVELKLQNGDFVGPAFKNEGEWTEGQTYYGANNFNRANKFISVVTINGTNGIEAYSCKTGGIATAQNKPSLSSDWVLLSKPFAPDLTLKQDKTDITLSTNSKEIVGAINELSGKIIDTNAIVEQTSGELVTIKNSPSDIITSKEYGILGNHKRLFGGVLLDENFVGKNILNVSVTNFSAINMFQLTSEIGNQTITLTPIDSTSKISRFVRYDVSDTFSAGSYTVKLKKSCNYNAIIIYKRDTNERLCECYGDSTSFTVSNATNISISFYVNISSESVENRSYQFEICIAPQNYELTEFVPYLPVPTAQALLRIVTCGNQVAIRSNGIEAGVTPVEKTINLTAKNTTQQNLIDLASIGNVRDEVLYENGKWLYKKNVQKATSSVTNAKPNSVVISNSRSSFTTPDGNITVANGEIVLYELNLAQTIELNPITETLTAFDGGTIFETLNNMVSASNCLVDFTNYKVDSKKRAYCFLQNKDNSLLLTYNEDTMLRHKGTALDGAYINAILDGLIQKTGLTL